MGHRAPLALVEFIKRHTAVAADVEQAASLVLPPSSVCSAQRAMLLA